ncbi:hypothetical protein L211DRAFT_891961, partial [Terfezia boudieri ATCC MYA-4762]
HRLKKTRHPVRSAISKLQIARSVLWWVTTWESLVLQIFLFYCLLPIIAFYFCKPLSLPGSGELVDFPWSRWGRGVYQ